MSNIFLQSAHAITLRLILCLWNLPVGNAETMGALEAQGWWLKPAMLGLLIPVSSIVGRMINTWLELIGINEDALVSSGMAKATGMGAFAGVLLNMFPGAGTPRGGAGFSGGGFFRFPRRAGRLSLDGWRRGLPCRLCPAVGSLPAGGISLAVGAAVSSDYSNRE